METLYFKVAGLCFAVQATEARNIKRLLPSYAPFNIPEPTDKLVLTATIADGEVSAEPEGEELGQFDSGNGNHGVYRLKDGYKIVTSTITGHMAAAMRANADFSQCVITLLSDNQSDRNFGLGNSMMIAFAFSAAYYGVLLMHSSVAMKDGKGYLFLGKSGTGKSTHSSLWLKHIPDTDLLNDDNPAVRALDDGTCIVYGTPWSGKTPCYRNLQVPIGAFVRLEQYPENIIARESPLKAFASILSSCSTMIWDKPSYAQITKTIERVVQHCPAYYLKCLPDQAAAELCYETASEARVQSSKFKVQASLVD